MFHNQHWKNVTHCTNREILHHMFHNKQHWKNMAAVSFLGEIYNKVCLDVKYVNSLEFSGMYVNHLFLTHSLLTLVGLGLNWTHRFSRN